MKRPSWLRKSGPFKCVSLANGQILVHPSWSQYGEVWSLHQGGGPGFPGRMSLAADLEEWLNSIYAESDLMDATKRIALHKKNQLDAELQMQREGYRGGYWAFFNRDLKTFTHFAATKAGVEIQMLDRKPKGRIMEIEVTQREYNPSLKPTRKRAP